MDQFSTYIHKLDELLLIKQSPILRASLVDAALDGEAGRESRELIGLSERRRDGIFFTSSNLREFAFSAVASSLKKEDVVFSPTIVAGLGVPRCQSAPSPLGSTRNPVFISAPQSAHFGLVTLLLIFPVPSLSILAMSVTLRPAFLP